MSSNPTSPLRKAWFRWKALRLPWRKKFLVGLDLSGATFWEFADKLSPDPTRMRRIVQYPRNVHYSDVSSHITPAWHQWLRHTRTNPPTIAEQQQDVVRQAQLKVLAAQADARWSSKKSALDTPKQPSHERVIGAPGTEGGQRVSDLRVKDPGDYTEEVRPDGNAVTNATMDSDVDQPVVNMQKPDGKKHPFMRGERQHEIAKDVRGKREDPWKKARGAPGEEWQPQAWDPNTMAAKR